MRVVDPQFMRGRAQRGENGVEKNRVGREFQFQIGVGIDCAVLLARVACQQENGDYE
jgi:hypothetical protein